MDHHLPVIVQEGSSVLGMWECREHRVKHDKTAVTSSIYYTPNTTGSERQKIW